MAKPFTLDQTDLQMYNVLSDYYLNPAQRTPKCKITMMRVKDGGQLNNDVYFAMETLLNHLRHDVNANDTNLKTS